MRVGVPKEIKNNEERVGLTPSCVRQLVERGHAVIVEADAGAGIGFYDEDYEAAGGHICTADLVWKADLVVKVKEPVPEEYPKLREGLTLFTYLHLAAVPDLTRALMDSRTTAIAYETVSSETGGLPLLQPMSAVAGRLSIQVGAHALERVAGGRGVLLGGVPGVAPAKVVVIGGGIAGTHATQMAVGLGANVTVVEKNPSRRVELECEFGVKIEVAESETETIGRLVGGADLVIGSVLVPGASAPKLVTADMVRSMERGSALVDIAIDQGGCFETSRPTTHDDPTYIWEGVVHYCVTNMPGTVSRTSTQALTAVTMPYVLKIADQGWRAVAVADRHFRNGLNVHDGLVWNRPVAESLGLMSEFRDPASV